MMSVFPLIWKRATGSIKGVEWAHRNVSMTAPRYVAIRYSNRNCSEFDICGIGMVSSPFPYPLVFPHRHPVAAEIELP